MIVFWDDVPVELRVFPRPSLHTRNKPPDAGRCQVAMWGPGYDGWHRCAWPARSSGLCGVHIRQAVRELRKLQRREAGRVDAR